MKNLKKIQNQKNVKVLAKTEIKNLKGGKNESKESIIIDLDDWS